MARDVAGGHNARVRDDTATVVILAPDRTGRTRPVEAAGWREWPARLPEQPIFYPVLTEEYATKIARDWNVPASGSG